MTTADMWWDKLSPEQQTSVYELWQLTPQTWWSMMGPSERELIRQQTMEKQS